MKTLRTLTLLLTLGFFFSAATANACDGDKASCKGHGKVTKTAMKDCKDPKCMKNGKCTMTAAEMKKSGCCAADGKAMSMKNGKAQCAPGTASSGKHDCCKGKPAAEKS